jgi:signal transduction histidine kinase
MIDPRAASGIRWMPRIESVVFHDGAPAPAVGSVRRVSGDERGQTSPDPIRLGEDALRRLLEVGRTLVSELDLESVLRRVLETAGELTGARYAALGILDERKEELERFLTVGIDEETRQAIGPLPRGRGVLGELIRNPEPLRLAVVTDHARSYGFPPGHPPMTSFLGVPIAVRGEAYGNLYLTDKENGVEFTEDDEQFVVVLSEWAAVAIDNARLYENVARRRAELERAVRGLEATSAIARAVGFETDLDRVLELIVKRGRAVCDARSLLVLLQEGEALRVAAAAGEIGSAPLGAEIPAEGTLAGSVLATGAGELVPDLETRAGHGLDRVAGGARSAVVVPLGFRGRARGVLIALDRLRDGPAFDRDDEHLLRSFAASAAIAIATAQTVSSDRFRLSMRASERERSRWARELHDETLQELGALKLLLQAVRHSDDPAAVERAIGQSIEQIDLSIRNLQGLITELRPAALDELGLQPAIESLLERTSATSGLIVESEVELGDEEGGAARLEPELESAIYRLLQESLTNAVKHARAERVKVRLSQDPATIVVTVSDDGSGFDTQRADGGFGLIGMQERVELVGGRLTIESAPGEGTTVRAELPAYRSTRSLSSA